MTVRRKANAPERRQHLCDTAIEVLAVGGLRGLSHIKVDRAAGVPDGTTSFHYRTRSALLHGAAQRLAELDRSDLESVVLAQPNADAFGTSSQSTLAEVVMIAAQQPALTRSRARFELLMEAHRDHELGDLFRRLFAEYDLLIREAIVQLQPADVQADQELLDRQVSVVTTYLNGLILDFVQGRTHTFGSVGELDALLRAMVAGIAFHARGLGPVASA